MFKPFDMNDPVRNQRSSIHGDALDSMHELRNILNRDPPLIADEGKKVTRHLEGNVTNGVEYADFSYGAAASRLRDMLAAAPSGQQSGQKTVLFSHPEHVRLSTNEFTPLARLPKPEEFLHLIQTQSSKIQHLLAQRLQQQNDLQNIKLRMLEVVEENRALHEELNKSVVDEIMQSGFGPTKLTASSPVQHQLMTRFDHSKWQKELERINALHGSKTSRLEAQLAFNKDECKKYEKQVMELESKLRSFEAVLESGVDMSMTGPVVGLCIQCSQNEALLPASVSQSQKQLLESVTRDRDELGSQVSMLKVRLEEMKHREQDSYIQVKSSIEMVEQSQLEMAQAFIEREQIREELENTRSRFEEHVGKMQKNISEACELARRESQGVQNELEARVKELLQHLAEVQSSFDRCNRDKMALVAELEGLQSQLSNVDIDYSKATDSMKVGIAQANIERNLAKQQVMRLKQELDQSDRERNAEKSRLREELEDVRRRLHRAEKEVLEAKEDCIQMHTANQALEKELHVTRMAKESLECTFGDNVRAAEVRAEVREVELSTLIDNLQAKHARTTAELEEIVHKHESLEQKLREECSNLVHQLEVLSRKYKSENSHLKSSNEQLKGKLHQLTRQLNELNNRLAQQNGLQEKMRKRLHEMDGEIHLNSQQKLDLLAKESVLLLDRQQLTRQVEFLHHQLVAPPPITNPDKQLDDVGVSLSVDNVLTADTHHKQPQWEGSELEPSIPVNNRSNKEN